ncbi:MAG: cation diffusion facilitator family transporter [Candidatus Aenigmatarchaeota archaeon]
MEDENLDFFKEGRKTSIIAGIGTLLFALAKGIVGLLSGSIVLLGDSIHSAADSFSAFVVWFGLKIAQKDPTEKFPYGFYKVENISSLFVSGLILFAGYTILKESISKFSSITSLEYPLFALSIAGLDAIVMFMIGTYEIKEGNKINSQSLVADGKESRLHVLSSSIVLVGLISSILGIPYLEAIAGILISLFIFQAGLESGKDSIYALLDVSPSEDIEKEVIKIIGGISGVEGFGNLKLRKSGPFVFGECTVKIRKHVDVDRAHVIAENLERKIKKEIDRIDSFTIRIEPYKTPKERIVVPVKDNNGKDSKIMDHFGRSNYFAIVSIGKDENKIDDVKIVENEYKDKEIRAGLSASRFVAKEKIDALLSKEIGEISLHTLRDNLIDIFKVEGKDLESAVKNYMNGKLERMEEPTREKD